MKWLKLLRVYLNINVQEITLVNQTQELSSDINSYVSTLENVYKQEIDKITIMLNRLNNFKQLLQEERTLSEKIIKAHETLNTFQTENETNLDISNNYLL